MTSYMNIIQKHILSGESKTSHYTDLPLV